MTRRWLWVTAVLPARLSAGGLVYSFELARAVAERGAHVHVVGLQPDASGLAVTEVPGADLVVDPVPGSLRSPARCVLSRLPNQTAAAATPSVVRRVTELLDEEWDAIVVDALRSAWVVPLLAERPAAGVLLTQNHEASMRPGLVSSAGRWSVRRPMLAFDAAKVRRLELRATRAVDVVGSITEEDLVRFRADAPDSTHVVLPPGWSGSPPGKVPPIAERPRRVVVFGSYNWHVKQENLRRFVRAADPVLADGGVELVVGGRVPDSVREQLGELRATTFAGWVDDPQVLFDTCRLGVVAEPLGGGFKMKALDYMFRLLPVASLSACTAGLPLVDGVSMLEAPDEVSLARRIVDQIDDVDRLEAYARSAAENAVRHFSWSTTAQRLIDVVDDVCHRNSGAREEKNLQ